MLPLNRRGAVSTFLGVRMISGKSSLEVSKLALDGTMMGNLYDTPRPMVCGTPKRPQYQEKILSAADIQPFQERPVELRYALEDKFTHLDWGPDIGLAAASTVVYANQPQRLEGQERHVGPGI